MFNAIEYYYGYFLSWLGFNKINPGNQTLKLEEAEDEEPDFDFDVAREPAIQETQVARKATIYYYSYKNYNNSFAVRGFTKEKTNAMIQNAFNEMSRVSGLKIQPWRKGLPIHFSIQFSSKVSRNALAVMDGKKMIISTVRPMTEGVVKTVVQHEFLHFLKYKANPPADQWAHSTDKSCVFNINGNAPKLCKAEEDWLRSKFGSP
jgi:hypothetical protein